MSSPSKQFAGLKVTKTRDRRGSDTGLPSPAESNFGPIIQAPVPERDIVLYTDERLKQSLDYAVNFLNRRDISPRSTLFMTSYRKEVEEALEAQTPEQRKVCIEMIMAEERLIHEKRFLNPLEKSAKQKELEANLLELRELQYMARYGDYLKILPNKVKQHAIKHQTTGWELLSGYWTRIAGQMNEEEAEREEVVRMGYKLNRMPVSAAVSVACDDLGLAWEPVVWSIKEYGARNKAVHRDQDDLIKEGKFSVLASNMCADRNDLYSTFGVIRSKTDLDQLRAIIQNLIDNWFEVADEDQDNPEAWRSSLTLVQLRKDANKPSKKDAKKAEDLRRSEEKVERQKAASMGKSSAAGKKRIVSTEEPQGSEREGEGKAKKR